MFSVLVPRLEEAEIGRAAHDLINKLKPHLNNKKRPGKVSLTWFRGATGSKDEKAKALALADYLLWHQRKKGFEDLKGLAVKDIRVDDDGGPAGPGVPPGTISVRVKLVPG